METTSLSASIDIFNHTDGRNVPATNQPRVDISTKISTNKTATNDICMTCCLCMKQEGDRMGRIELGYKFLLDV